MFIVLVKLILISIANLIAFKFHNTNSYSFLLKLLKYFLSNTYLIRYLLHRFLTFLGAFTILHLLRLKPPIVKVKGWSIELIDPNKDYDGMPEIPPELHDFGHKLIYQKNDCKTCFEVVRQFLIDTNNYTEKHDIYFESRLNGKFMHIPETLLSSEEIAKLNPLVEQYLNVFPQYLECFQMFSLAKGLFDIYIFFYTTVGYAVVSVGMSTASRIFFQFLGGRWPGFKGPGWR